MSGPRKRLEEMSSKEIEDYLDGASLKEVTELTSSGHPPTKAKADAEIARRGHRKWGKSWTLTAAGVGVAIIAVIIALYQ